jgi:hypothetical protein
VTFVEWMNSLPTGVGGLIGIAAGVVLVVTLQIAVPRLLGWLEDRRMAKWAASWCPCGKPKAHESWCTHRVRLK